MSSTHLDSKYGADIEDEIDDEDEEDDEEYNEADAEAEEREAAAQDVEETGASRKRGRGDKSARVSSQPSGKRNRMQLEAVDDEELAALREDAVEQFGADVLNDGNDGKSAHTRAAERAELDALMSAMHREEEQLLQPRPTVGSVGATGTQPGNGRVAEAVINAALRQVRARPAQPEPLVGLACIGPVDDEDAVRQAHEEEEPGKDSKGQQAVADLLRGKYGHGNGWADGPQTALPASCGPYVRRLATRPPLDLDAVEVRPSEDGAGQGQRQSAPCLTSHPAIAEHLRSIASQALALAGGKKLAVTSTVKFAGQTMTVTKMVTAGSDAAKQAQVEAAAMKARAEMAALGSDAPVAAPSESSSAGAGVGAGASSSAAPSRPLGLDAVVSGLDKPAGINTLAKTNLDWEQYKATAGLDETFEAKARSAGFVEKQAFLGRVDDRAEAQAKARRAEERRQRDLAVPGQR